MSRKEVIDKTLGEIRTFLDEISNGTSHYRSLHNLTEQVEHQYHGRFLIELIQNAHDALFEAEKTQTSQHIEIVLAEDEYPYGALYIANGGQPFTPSNFKALSNLGQSDKYPQKCIGNKGIGFRSVLEITKEPEIYSRKEKGGSIFDGYCFRFSPDVIRLFEGSIGRVVEGENEVEPPEGFEGQLLEWDDARYETLRQRCRSSHEVRKKLDYLSPYALPIPLDSRQANNIVEDFEQRGLSTVVRLPFFDESGIDVASEKLEEINETTIIFLRRVNILRIINKGVERIYTRKQIARTDDPEEGFEVQIIGRLSKPEAAEDCSQTYWLWQRSVGGENNSSERDEINRAVAKLPGKWPELDEATVEIAVQVGGQPCDGLLNIYLPTRIPSGCVAQFNAPFYGDMSRTDVDFDQPFNAMLLEAIAEKGVNVIQKCLSGKGEAEAAAIIDILAPSDDEQGRHWWNALDQVFKEKDIDIKESEIAKSDMGWRSFACAKLLPKLESDFVVNVSLLRSEAKHPVFVSSLQEREAWLRRIFEKIGISCEAMPEQNAVTVEAIAKKLNVSEGPVD